MTEPMAPKSVKRAAGEKPQRYSKMEKKQKNLYLSAHARQLLSELSLRMGVSETAVVELLVREKAARENLTVPSAPESAPETSPQ